MMSLKRTGKITLLILIILSICIFAGCSVKTALKNTGFENGSGSSIEDWIQYNYNKSQGDTGSTYFTLETEGGIDGQYLKIESLRPNDARIYQEIEVKKGGLYKVTLKYKTENIQGAEGPDAEDQGAGFNISAIDAMSYSSGIYGTSDGWQDLVAYVQAGEKQSEIKLSIGIGCYGLESMGSVCIDNITIEKVSELPSGYSAVKAEPWQSSSSNENGSASASFIAKTIFALALVGMILFAILLARLADKENFEKKQPLSQKIPKVGKKDLIILLVMTLVCGIMSFYKLGNMYAPSSYWRASQPGDYVVIEFDKAVDVKRISYSTNIPNSYGSYLVEYEDEASGAFKSLLTISDKNNNVGSFFEWSNKSVHCTTKRIKVSAVSAGLPLNEMGFFTTNAAGEFEQLDITITDSYATKNDENGDPSALFDEQDTVEAYKSYMNGTYFDEIYFPRTAYEGLNGLSIYETTHPPLGKIIQSLGILIFGMNPFGWRFTGTLFGVLMVPLMYLFGLKLFKQRKFAFMTAFLVMFDFMRLSQTRLATIDSYSCFFIIAMYYFMYDYFVVKSYERSMGRSLLPLFLCGIMFGLGAASKWTVLYGGCGLALLFFLAKALEAEDYARGRFQIVARKEKGAIGKFLEKYHINTDSWLMSNFFPTCFACVFFFILIPGTIYVLSYIPYQAANPGVSLWDLMWNNQEYMLNYHSGLNATHPYQSAWWEWPIDKVPILYYVGGNAGLESGTSAAILSMGNPAVWWAGLAAIFPSIYFAWKRREKGMILVTVAYGMQFIPWILVTRCAFIYHYFTAVPFMIFMLVYCIKCLLEDKLINKYIVWAYLAIVLLLFIMFYPILMGLPIDTDWYNSLKWFSTWKF